MMSTPTRNRQRAKRRGDVRDPLWYKDAIIYEAHVRAFFDSSADGMGDFRGLTHRLDYLQDLGITAVWLLPFYPSPWRDDGYDIADYADVHPAYGALRDFKEFLREAHRREIKVITELVINHTSDQHPWFQRARRAKPGTPARDFYVWTDDPSLYKEARIIFKDFESSNWAWDPVANAYYWHRFYSHQPDLNFDNPAVHEAIFKLMDYWFEMGVDGMRLDAIPYLYERPGTNCENLPETHDFLKKLRANLDAKFEGRMFLAEANQWPEDTVPYFGDGDECHMNFHFPVMPRLFMSIQMEDRFPIIDILKQTPPIPENSQWATFLRNHDELTLEMVTDEERDYMYRMFAHDPQARINLGIRRRLAPLLQNNRRKIELMNALLFSLPGTPVLYYGDEIGMGDNIYLGDRNGVRTPMQWSADRNAGFSRANPQRLYLPVIVDPEYHYETVNVEAQQANPSSLLWWTKRLIALRKRFRAFSRGTIEFLYPDNRKVLAFLRCYDGERIMVVANLSRFAQYASLDLQHYRDHVPVELFGMSDFPRITAQPYQLTLGPHSFLWFQLRAAGRPGVSSAEQRAARPRLDAPAGWDRLLERRSPLTARLPEFLGAQRWFQGKARPLRNMAIADTAEVHVPGETHRIAFVRVEYVEGEPELYVLPLTAASGEAATRLQANWPDMILADLEQGPEEAPAVLYDGLASARLQRALLELVRGRRRVKAGQGDLVGTAYAGLPRGAEAEEIGSRLLGREQSNTSVLFGRELVMKVYRRVEDGTSLDLELGRFLSTAGFRHTPAVLGALEYRVGERARTIAIVQEFVPNEGDAWGLTLDAVAEFQERAAALSQEAPAVDTGTAALLALATRPATDEVLALIGGVYLEEARLLGQRTGEMHIALASDRADPAFAPEPFTLFYQRSLYQSMRNLAGRTLQLLSSAASRLSPPLQKQAAELAAHESLIMTRFRRIVHHRVGGMRIRVHGDYHLGQVLFTGNDFVITDFEGEPLRPLSERRLKRSPLRDVAGMLRSFDYVAHSALLERASRELHSAQEQRQRAAWSSYWYVHAAAAFLRGYFSATANAAFLPPDVHELTELLDGYLLEKGLYELSYELNNRPDWAAIPLRGVLELLEQA
ncbi:MAG TPA: maltose alpha-D-glucosyltransferase [Longimicrobiales bacterium]|nr:maltose alpha-D-glucosyltransferase [Longimicrobiales bacterium]